MLTLMAKQITQMLIQASLIEEGDTELYCYGFFVLISRAYYFLITITIGLFMHIPIESIVFYVVFILLRSYAGGVHAKKESVCNAMTTLALITAVVGNKQLGALGSNPIALLMLLFGSLCIVQFSPLDTEEKPLDDYEKSKYRQICVVIVFSCITASLIAHILDLPTMVYSVSCAVFLESILLIAGKFRSS